MTLVDDDDEALLEQRLAVDGAMIVDVAQDADVDRALPQRVVLPARHHVETLDRQLRLPLDQVHADAVDHLAETRRDADLHHAHRAVLHPCGELQEAARVGEQVARLLEQHRALAGEVHAGRGAHEQLDAELVFELADVTAERRLRDAKLARRLGEAARLGDGGERAQMTQVQEASCLPFRSRRPAGRER